MHCGAERSGRRRPNAARRDRIGRREAGGVDDCTGMLRVGEPVGGDGVLGLLQGEGHWEEWKAERGGLRAPRSGTRSQTTLLE